MALLKKVMSKKSTSLQDFEDYILLWKLEVLPKYQNRGVRFRIGLILGKEFQYANESHWQK